MKRGSRISTWTLTSMPRVSISAKFAESLVKAGREGVKWERRKLEWIREEKSKQEKAKGEAA